MKKILFTIIINLINIQQSVFANFQYLDLTGAYSETLNKGKALTKYNSIFPDLVGLGLSKNHIDSNLLNVISCEVNIKNFKNLKVLDLSDNILDEKSAETLAKWLSSNTTLKINLTGNPISLKNISKLYYGFKDLKVEEDTIQDFMSRIIFISKNYINKASKTVNIYNNLINEKIIPSNWATTHRIFYELSEVKNLTVCRESNKYRECMHHMKLLSLSPKKNIISDNNEVENHIEEELNFQEALNKIMPNERLN